MPKKKIKKDWDGDSSKMGLDDDFSNIQEPSSPSESEESELELDSGRADEDGPEESSEDGDLE